VLLIFKKVVELDDVAVVQGAVDADLGLELLRRGGEGGGWEDGREEISLRLDSHISARKRRQKKKRRASNLWNFHLSISLLPSFPTLCRALLFCNEAFTTIFKAYCNLVSRHVAQ